MSASLSDTSPVDATSIAYGVGICLGQRASESMAMPPKRLDSVGVRADSLEVSVVARNQALAPCTSLVLSRDCASYGTCSTLLP
ncbi:hypothetical protein K523DRAFT_285443, partial [Schizophyllum commune Tattone D]